MAQVESRPAQKSERKGVFAGLRRALTSVRPTETNLDLSADTRAKVVFSKVVPADEWRAVTTVMTEASRGRADIGVANDIISSWGAGSLISIQRSAHREGHPFTMRPASDEYRPPIATDALTPDGKPGVQVTVDRIIESEPQKKKVLARV
ncbi:MAG TPA: hypothetical protein VM077_05530 [Candidatus Limnocylindrales bacterium]|nr:hypothetical protein [Candidatus Limnocylindrales bacterium]